MPSWGSQERNASGTGGISTHRDTALTRERRTVISPRPVPSRTLLPLQRQSPSHTHPSPPKIFNVHPPHLQASSSSALVAHKYKGSPS